MTGVSEWVGGRLTSPFFVTEPEPYRPEMVLWLELPEDFVVASVLVDPNGPAVSFGDTLLDAMASPLAGPPRRPGRIRVSDARLAAEVRQAAPDIEVVVAPTPELDRLLELMTESSLFDGDGDASYFEGGRIAAQSIESLFRAAEALFRVAPWKVADDAQVLRLDIPALGVEGGCVSIIGALGESLGFIIFPSLMGFESFLNCVEAGRAVDGPIDLGTPTLSLNFERGADLPATMRREAVEHGWPVAGPAAYPLVQHRDRDGMPRPLTERDIHVVSAGATSLAAFFLKHRGLFKRDFFEPVCESFFDERDLEVRFTVPYEAGHLFEVNDPKPLRKAGAGIGKVGRNAPCPCGSGKKYKKCCLSKDRAARESARAPAALHETDQRLVEQMMRFGRTRFGDAWRRAAEDFDDHEASAQLFVPWAVYHVAIDGRPLVYWFVDAQGRNLSGTERQWLEAQQASWLSVWEVTAVEPGKRITLEDLLTGEARTVEEVSGSTTLVSRDAFLGRIVDHGGLSVLCGVHPRPLPPAEAAEVVRRVRGRLRRKRAIPRDRLREEKIGRYMIARWEEAVEDLDDRRRIPPRLENTDGEALLITVDHFEFDPGRREQVEESLASLEGVEAPEPGGRDRAYVFTRPPENANRGWDNKVVGSVEISGSKLRLETNSVERADLLRQRLESACGDSIRHLAREHSDPFSLLARSEGAPDPSEKLSEIPPAEADDLIRAFKEKHYADWADQPLPALEGRTPREAVRTKAGRGKVDVLLKDCENHEARIPEGQRFDFSGLRRDLGLEG
jgi:hypothetical protein